MYKYYIIVYYDHNHFVTGSLLCSIAASVMGLKPVSASERESSTE